MFCCYLRTVDLMHGFRQRFSVFHSLSAVGETFLSRHSWTTTSFPGSFLFQWVSWVTDDVMATRKKEVSKRHMKGKRRLRESTFSTLLKTESFSKWAVCCQCHQSDFLEMLRRVYFYTELDIQCLMEGSKCEPVDKNYY